MNTIHYLNTCLNTFLYHILLLPLKQNPFLVESIPCSRLFQNSTSSTFSRLVLNIIAARGKRGKLIVVV